MRIKYFIAFMISLLVISIGFERTYDNSELNSELVMTADNEENPLLIATGEICPIYEPKGQVLYNSEWTGALPSIDKVTEDYKTATFGLG